MQKQADRMKILLQHIASGDLERTYNYLQYTVAEYKCNNVDLLCV